MGEPFAPALPDGGLLYGRLAHALFEEAWSQSPDVSDAAGLRERFGEAFDRSVATHALTLDLPSARGRRSLVRESIGRAGEVLAGALREGGASVVGCEVALGDHRRLGDTRWTGRADLVLGTSPMVLDLKWSGARHRAALAQGTAVQLALYAWMLRGSDDTDADGRWPSVGYLIVTTGSLLATPGSPLREAEPVAGPALAQTVAAVGRGLDARSEERARGELLAPGALPERVREGLNGAALTLEPPCMGCACSALCGRGFGS